MKTKFFFSVLLLLLFNIAIVAQETETTNNDQDDFEIPDVEHLYEGIGGNLGLTTIGEETYASFRFKPELSFGKLGFGLDVPLMVNIQTGKLRIDEFKDGVGPLRMLRYVRWGVKKRDPLYFRIGELRDAQLGFGMMIDDYNNSISFEKRKLGFEFDFVVHKKFGLEVLYSDLNFNSFTMLGVRPYYKPFGASGIPIIKTFEIGAGFVTDHDKTFLVNDDSIQVRNNYFLDKGITSFAADMGFWIFNFNWLRWSVYAQAGYMPRVKSDTLAQYINTYGSTQMKGYLNASGGMGWAIGSDFKFKFLGNLLKINARAERFWHSDYYIPRFYTFAYELNKDNRILELADRKAEHGMYFQLNGSVLDKIILHSNIVFDDQINEEHPAEMYLGVDLSNMVDKLTFYTSLHKADITDFKSFVKFDDNTLFETMAAWQVYEVPVIKLQVIAGVDFKWTYALLKDLDFTATRYITPFVKLHIPLNKTEKQKEKDDIPADLM